MYETYVRPFLPDLGPRSIKTAVCLYTNAPGARFVIDRHPEHERVIFASPCSGHGFKHSAAYLTRGQLRQCRCAFHVRRHRACAKRLSSSLFHLPEMMFLRRKGRCTCAYNSPRDCCPPALVRSNRDGFLPYQSSKVRGADAHRKSTSQR
jgi:hypothetical protein